MGGGVVHVWRQCSVASGQDIACQGTSILKQKALNDALYTVWIDEAGIRAGHKWRNEIADGIQVSH